MPTYASVHIGMGRGGLVLTAIAAVLLALALFFAPQTAGTSSADGECQPGTYGTPGNCSPCQAGTFSDVVGAESCSRCPVGTYQDQDGQTACKLAPAGFYVDTEGAAEALRCPLGETSEAGATECHPITTFDKNDCKKGGWRNLLDANGNKFKNQGDCVSYVATIGKNVAAGGAP